MLTALLRYKGFIIGSVKRDFQLRYNRSMLGFLWLLVQPLSMIAIYTLVFSQVMKSKLPGQNNYSYSIYLCSGTIAWSFFVEVITRGQNMFIDNANMLKKINFPRLCIPVIVTFSSAINFSIIFGIFLCVLLVLGELPGIVMLSVVPIVVLQLLFSILLGLVLGILNVFFRDVGQVMGIVLQVWFWATPIVYPLAIIPDWARQYSILNPMTAIITSYQQIIVQHKSPEWLNLWPIITAILVLSTLVKYLFKKYSNDMVDEL